MQWMPLVSRVISNDVAPCDCTFLSACRIGQGPDTSVAIQHRLPVESGLGYDSIGFANEIVDLGGIRSQSVQAAGVPNVGSADQVEVVPRDYEEGTTIGTSLRVQTLLRRT